jgi:hypothetical protein
MKSNARIPHNLDYKYHLKILHLPCQRERYRALWKGGEGLIVAGYEPVM